MKPWIKSLNSTQHRSKKYSQSYQDSVIEIVFENLGTKNDIPFCVEFGFDSDRLTEGTTGSNTANLILNKRWNSLLLDGSHANTSINLHKHFITTENVYELFDKYRVPCEPEYISIDVDSTDLWLFDKISSKYRAMLFSVEYNAHFPLERAITFPDSKQEFWEGDRGYGASLKALNLVANRRGYSLVSVVPPLDAFFVRNDLIDDESTDLVPPFESWRNCTNLKSHKPLKNPHRLNLFLDYEVYLTSGESLEKSRQAAKKVCQSVLLDSPGRKLLNHVRAQLSRLRRILRHSK